MLRKSFVLIFLIIVSCGKDHAELKVTNFQKKDSITLEPYKFRPYAMLNLRVKGYCNDTVRLNYNLYGNTNHYIIGKVDTLLIQTDYYGETPVKFIFDPYRATEGELEIKVNL